MTANEIVDQLRQLGLDSYKRVLLNHGVSEPLFGVKVEEMKKIQKRVGKNYQLALDLYATGIFDAMYLAGLIADDLSMTRDDLRRWAEQASCPALSSSTVAWVSAESLHGRELALEWIESARESVASTGWSTYSSLVSIKDDADLDLAEIERLLRRVEETIHRQPNLVRSAMNGFVIAVGTYVTPLAELALATGNRIGQVSVDKGDTACKVPYAPDYIRKAHERGTAGRKRKSAKR